jgi:hypothetical protein
MEFFSNSTYVWFSADSVLEGECSVFTFVMVEDFDEPIAHHCLCACHSKFSLTRAGKSNLTKEKHIMNDVSYCPCGKFFMKYFFVQYRNCFLHFEREIDQFVFNLYSIIFDGFQNNIDKGVRELLLLVFQKRLNVILRTY